MEKGKVIYSDTAKKKIKDILSSDDYGFKLIIKSNMSHSEEELILDERISGMLKSYLYYIVGDNNG